LCCFNKIVDHGGCRGNVAQALARWWHPVASSEARNVLHRVMYPASHYRICMMIKIASVLRVFFVAVDFVVGRNYS
jgi:hypothetical protein